jgi:SAM-dependent methyltransferase
MTVPLNNYNTGLLSKDLPTEISRLRLLERTYDPGTIAVLERLGMAPDARCLEIGAGAGSIAYWMAERVPAGRVVAIDIDPRYADADRAPNLDVQRVDVIAEDFPTGSFDIVHARAVFMHLPQRAEVLAKVASWLAPGGWLVVEDVYFMPADGSPHPAWRRVHGAYLAYLAGQGVDLTWARRISGHMAEIGLSSVGVSVTPGGLGIDEVQNELLRVRLRQSGRRLVDAGLIDEDDLRAAAHLLERSPAPDVSTFVYSSWGRRSAPR